MSRFGHQLKKHWLLDPQTTYLNHGTVGATPIPVLEAQRNYMEAAERRPSKYLLRDIGKFHGVFDPTPSLMRISADAVGAFIGADGRDIVFVDNATTAINTILRSVRFAPNDSILVSDLGYGAINLAAQLIARHWGAHAVTAEIPFPVHDTSEYAAAILAAVDTTTKLVVIDHITSESSLVIPIQNLIAQLHARGVLVIVDGAHAIGSFPLAVESYGADWYITNLHKWGYAPRSSACIWTAPKHQAITRPLTISWGYEESYTRAFDWVGTRDYSPYLAAPDGIAFMQSLGLDELFAYNHALASAGANLVMEKIGTSSPTPQSSFGCMVTIPLPESFGSSAAEVGVLRDRLLYDEKIEVQIHAFRGRLWCRVGANIYNELSDFEKLAAALAS